MKLLYFFDLNARMPVSELAKKLHLSKVQVSYRLRKLEKEKIIKGYFTVIDIFKLGYASFRVYLKLQDLTSQKRQQLFKFLYEEPRVGGFTSVLGNWDLVLWLWVEDVSDFQDFWLDLMEGYGSNIERSWISSLLSVTHFNRGYLLPGKAQQAIHVLGESRIVSGAERIDELDWKILRLLSKNARRPLLDIARELGVSYKVISYRMRQLEKKKIILFYRVFLDIEKIDYTFYKVLFSLQNISRQNLRRLEAYLSMVPEAMYIDKFVGGADFEVEFQCLGSKQLRAILGSLQANFPDLIKNYDVLEYFDERKLSYLPPLSMVHRA